MKYVLSLLVLAFAIGSGSSFAQFNDEDEFWEEDEEYWTDEDLTMFETNNYTEDQYGYYDEDFDWEADDEEFDEWYETAGTDWTEYDEANEEWWDIF